MKIKDIILAGKSNLAVVGFAVAGLLLGLVALGLDLLPFESARKLNSKIEQISLNFS